MKTVPVDTRVHALLSEAAQCLAAERMQKAKKLCEDAVRLAPSSADAHMVLADVLAARRETEAARKHYQKATSCERYHFGAWLNYGVFLKENKELNSAVLAFRNASMIDPRSSLARYNLARVLYDAGEYREAAEAFDVFCKMEPGFADGHHSLSVTQELAGDYDAAVDSARKAMRIDPKLSRAYLQLGGLYRALGKFDEADRVLRQGIEVNPAGNKSYAALISANAAPGVADDQEALEQIRAELDKDDLAVTARAHFLFAGAKILDRRKEYDEAFRFLMEANSIRDAAMDKSSARMIRLWREMTDHFPEAFFADRKAGGHETEQPVFIVGMPRSGTTLTEQILATHARVYGAGELTSLTSAINEAGRSVKGTYPEFVAGLPPRDLKKFAESYIERYPDDARGFDRVTDKMPQNFLHLGTLSVLFPNARFIFCRRNPIDTCLSCFMQNFASDMWFAFDLEKLASAYRMHIELMDHWKRVLPGRIHEVVYEDLTGNPEPHARALIEFCGLEWDEACLDFHKTDRGIRTASVWQVRQPMYTSSVGKWKDYETHLGPLVEGLGDLVER